MRYTWLQSKPVSVLFLWSAVVCVGCLTFVFFIIVPSIREFLNSSSANNVMGGLFVGLVALTVPCSLIIGCGMALFCASTDSSTAFVKVLWFLLFFFAFPFGSIVYYFTVYRKLIKRMRPDLLAH